MLKVKKPKAIVYGWTSVGIFDIPTDVYFEEGLYYESSVISLEWKDTLEKDFCEYSPDLIISIGLDINVPEYLLNRYFFYQDTPQTHVLANDIVCQSTFTASRLLEKRPYFSIFTPVYNTPHSSINRAYQSLCNQTYKDWEWVILDDSSEPEVWDYVTEITKKDPRVKLYRVQPRSFGNIGLVKNRVASFCSGQWLVELDHDDALISTCLEECKKASEKFPDAGFIYTDCCELHENGDWRSYYEIREDFYGREENWFNFGYSGHTIEEADGKKYLRHHYAEINPITIRFNITMPNHARMWKRDLYYKIGGHNKELPVADDFDLIVRTFLETRIIHVKKMLYLQYNNFNSTVDNNSININLRSRLIRDFYDKRIHERILGFGKKDWLWIEEQGNSRKLNSFNKSEIKFFEEEQYMNYIYE
jgi:glycosyltransferase involved in cell wall biosynthesis